MYANEIGIIGVPRNERKGPPKRFMHTDTIREFSANLRKQPADWVYRKLRIEYLYNSLGHRAKEPDKLKPNFIMFTGCSQTEGVGLPVESTYSSLIAEKFRSDYYNIALGGTGPDVVYYNLKKWFESKLPKPRLVVIQWPEPLRYSHIGPDFNNKLYQYFDAGVYNDPGVVCSGIWDMTNDRIEGRLVESMQDFPEIHKMTCDLLQFYGVPLLDFHMLQGLKLTADYSVKMAYTGRVIMLDYARDIMHPGIRTNKELAKVLINKINRDNLL